MSYFNTTNLGYQNQKSPDGRLRTSSQLSLGDYKQFANNASGQYHTVLIGTGAATYESGLTGGTALAVTSNLDAAIRQTYQWHNYFAGKPQKIELTASRFHTESNVIKRFGYYSSNTTTPFNSTLDGMYFENDGTTIRCKVMRAGTEIFNKPQANWENQNQLAAYDPTDFNFYVIDFLYLGGAVVNFYILTSYGLTLIATYQHINVDVSTFIKSPNQPVRYEIRSTGGAGVFNQICADVAVEGLVTNVGANRSWDMGSTPMTGLAANTRYALMGIRLANRNIVAEISKLSVLSTANDNILVHLYIGGTLVGTPTWSAITYTNMEGWQGSISGSIANNVHSGGVRISSAYVKADSGQTNGNDTLRRIGSYIDGTVEQLYLTVTPLSAGAAAVAAINWNEYI